MRDESHQRLEESRALLGRSRTILAQSHALRRMPHSLGVAIASQVIAILATTAIPPAVIYLIRGGW